MTEDPCARIRMLADADADGELTPAEAAEVAAHLDQCAGCAAAQAELLALKARLRADMPVFAAPAGLADAIRAKAALIAPASPVPKPRRPWSFKAAPSFGAGFATALAACLALVLIVPRPTTPADAVVAAHIRALLPGHLMDVASSDQHTVKPWFDGRLPFAPPVKDLKAVGFPLIGGRLDYLDGHMAAALVYRHGAHDINLFVWPAKAAELPVAMSGEVDGYHFLRWARGGMVFWAVSDMNPRDLEDFRERWGAV